MSEELSQVGDKKRIENLETLIELDRDISRSHIELLNKRIRTLKEALDKIREYLSR